MKKPKRGSFVEWCISIIILRIFTVRKLSSSMQRCKEKGWSVGYCKGLYLVKNQFVTAKWCMWLVVLEFLKYRFLLDLKNMTPFHLAAKIGHFLLFNSFINKLSNGWFWLLNGVESKISRYLHFTIVYITEMDQF